MEVMEDKKIYLDDSRFNPDSECEREIKELEENY